MNLFIYCNNAPTFDMDPTGYQSKLSLIKELFSAILTLACLALMAVDLLSKILPFSAVVKWIIFGLSIASIVVDLGTNIYKIISTKYTYNKTYLAFILADIFMIIGTYIGSAFKHCVTKLSYSTLRKVWYAINEVYGRSYSFSYNLYYLIRSHT